MKRFASIVPVILIFALALALPVATFAKTHDMKAEVVSIDEKAKTITLKDAQGENHTAPLLGKALSEAKNFKAGDMVMATCDDDDKTGEHKGVSGLKKEKPVQPA